MSSLSMSFPKKIVIETLTKNRDTHKIAYQDNVTNWLKSVLEKSCDLEKAIKKPAKEVNVKDVRVSMEEIHKLTPPTHFLPAYDRAIEMLNLSLDENIQMNADQYKEYMKDEWDWKKQWQYSNSKYSMSLDWED